MKTTRPKELIYFNFLPTQLQEGVHFMYYAIDDFSTFAFVLGVTNEFTHQSVLRHIKKLMKDKDFKSSPKKPFTLMCSCGHDIEKDIQAIIAPYKGNVVFDTDTVIQKTQHFVNELNQQIM